MVFELTFAAAAALMSALTCSFCSWFCCVVFDNRLDYDDMMWMGEWGLNVSSYCMYYLTIGGRKNKLIIIIIVCLKNLNINIIHKVSIFNYY